MYGLYPLLAAIKAVNSSLDFIKESVQKEIMGKLGIIKNSEIEVVLKKLITENGAYLWYILGALYKKNTDIDDKVSKLDKS